MRGAKRLLRGEESLRRQEDKLIYERGGMLETWAAEQVIQNPPEVKAE